jgi:hypothetical protein
MIYEMFSSLDHAAVGRFAVARTEARLTAKLI